ncbi:MAG TPA: helix-turn-helix domain-containing protein [Verrucomicrobiae bacterium]|nr:helix-turn-helix domain-containing protein [Verrucomicrobiae bacterium]
MPTVSEQLRQAREARNVTIQEAAEVTKIRTDHLRALEAGNYDVFSAPVYIKGFVRSYSGFLKLDIPSMMAALEAELRGTSKFSEPPPLSPETSGGFLDFLMLQLSRLGWRKGMAAGIAAGVLLVAIIVFLIVRHAHRANPLAGLKPGVYHSTNWSSADTLPLPAPPARK